MYFIQFLLINQLILLYMDAKLLYSIIFKKNSINLEKNFIIIKFGFHSRIIL
jgi:hypothetical protein